MPKELRPLPSEVKRWIIATLRHSCMVEFYLDALHLDNLDPQRPHDLNGEGNKFSWPVLKGLALQYRSNSDAFFQRYVQPSIDYHREHQYHHQMWNKENPLATPEDMKAGAVDTLCSLLDNRPYQGGPHTFEEIPDIVAKNPAHQQKWFWMVYSQMKRLGKLAVERINNPDDVLSMELPNATTLEIHYRTEEALRMLKGEYGYPELFPVSDLKIS